VLIPSACYVNSAHPRVQAVAALLELPWRFLLLSLGSLVAGAIAAKISSSSSPLDGPTSRSCEPAGERRLPSPAILPRYATLRTHVLTDMNSFDDRTT